MEAHEIELVKRVQAGDEQAFDELYQQYYPRAISLAYRFTKDYADAEDVVQESFIQVHKSIHTLQEPAYFYSWLNRIIHSKCVNMFYRNRNENTVDPSKMEAVKTYEEKRRYMLPQRESDYISEQEVLQRILAQMDEKYREVIALAYLQQMKLEEIAEYLDMPLGTVKTRCRRAKTELKRLVAEFEKAENRKISFEANAALPAVTVFSLANCKAFIKQHVTSFFTGPAVNIAVAASITALTISGTVMAVQDYNQAKEADNEGEKIVEQPDGSADKTNQMLTARAFGNYTYDDMKITNSREAYFVLINFASTKEEMQNKTTDELDCINVIYKALQKADDQYYQMLKQRGWSELFELVYDEKV